jgi:iron complex transport system substrate-binding protein
VGGSRWARARAVALAGVVMVSTLAACGQAEIESPAAAGATSGGVQLQRCGQQIRLAAPAARAVTLNQHATELVLAMGLGDRLIGSSLLDNPVRPDLKPAYDKVEVLSERAYPSKETLVGLRPDVLIGGFGPTFSEANGLPPDQFTAAGISLFTVQCKGDRLTLDYLRQTVTTLGALFGDPAAARRLNAALSAQMDKVRAQVAGKAPVNAMIFDSGKAAPVVGGGPGLAGTLLEAAGGRNVFADLPKDWSETSWEEVVKRDPQVIVVADYLTSEATAAQKIDQMRRDPVLRGVRAVRDNRFVVVGLTGLGAISPRNAEVAQQIAAALHPRR